MQGVVKWTRLVVVAAVGLAVAVVGFGSVAGAQTGDLPAFCAARIEANSAETKAENKAVIEKVLNAAPAAAVPAVTAIRDGFEKKGQKFFESRKGAAALAQLDAFVYDNCPGVQVPVTAIDYEFQGVPATLAPGVTKFELTNSAPKENHEMALFGLTPEGAALDPEELLSKPEKKLDKFVDFSSGVFMFAPAGETGYGIGDLQPGKYVYACFVPIGGKKNGAPHFTQGMYGTLTVG